MIGSLKGLLTTFKTHTFNVFFFSFFLFTADFGLLGLIFFLCVIA